MWTTRGASPPGGGIRPDGEETERPGTGGQPWDATAAARTRRWPLPVAVIGDGSFQLTAQELANMIRHGQETMIFLDNNRGYVSESAIHDGPYNGIPGWPMIPQN
jgi:hypothetical protein